MKCAAPDCAACDLEPRDGESEADWKARIRALAQADEHCVNGHLWSENTHLQSRTGIRVCRACNREALRRSRARKKERAA